MLRYSQHCAQGWETTKELKNVKAEVWLVHFKRTKSKTKHKNVQHLEKNSKTVVRKIKSRHHISQDFELKIFQIKDLK